MAHGLSCSAACGIFLDQGLNPFSPALAGGLLTTAPAGKYLRGLRFFERLTEQTVQHFCEEKVGLEFFEDD